MTRALLIININYWLQNFIRNNSTAIKIQIQSNKSTFSSSQNTAEIQSMVVSTAKIQSMVVSECHSGH